MCFPHGSSANEQTDIARHSRHVETHHGVTEVRSLVYNQKKKNKKTDASVAGLRGFFLARVSFFKIT